MTSSIGWDASHDADRHFAAEEDAAECERMFYVQHADRIATVAAGICANSTVHPFVMGQSDIVDLAAQIVRHIHDRGADPYTGEWPQRTERAP